MAEFVTFTLKVAKEKYEGDDGLRAIAVEALNYPHTVQATDEEGNPIVNEDGTPKIITNPISEDQFVKIAIKENAKKFFRDLKNLRNSRRATKAGVNDFELI